jgi:acyl carrier protein
MSQTKIAREKLRVEIRDYIQQSLLKTRVGPTLTFDDNLIETLSSLQLLRMVLELESRYAVAIPNSDLTPENLGTVERVAAYVAARSS